VSSQIRPRPANPGRGRHFCRDLLGLAIYREFGAQAIVFACEPGIARPGG
jgi:hypothetical protein